MTEQSSAAQKEHSKVLCASFATLAPWRLTNPRAPPNQASVRTRALGNKRRRIDAECCGQPFAKLGNLPSSGQAAVHHDGLARDIARIVARQPRRRVRDRSE